MKWRFADLENFPAAWAGLVHEGAPDEMKEQPLSDFFDKPNACCRGEHFDQKMFSFFRGSKQALKDSNAFKRLIKAFAQSHRLTNMDTERHLAGIRAACPDGCAERIVSAGHLKRLVQTHLSRGREDPRFLSRSQLLKEDLPIRCNNLAKAAKPAKQCGVFTHFTQRREAQRKIDKLKYNRDEYRNWKKELSEEWSI